MPCINSLRDGVLRGMIEWRGDRYSVIGTGSKPTSREFNTIYDPPYGEDN